MVAVNNNWININGCVMARLTLKIQRTITNTTLQRYCLRCQSLNATLFPVKFFQCPNSTTKKVNRYWSFASAKEEGLAGTQSQVLSIFLFCVITAHLQSVPNNLASPWQEQPTRQHPQRKYLLFILSAEKFIKWIIF